MHRPVTEKLKGKGLDVGFLAWLEGESDTLPRLDRIRKIKGEDFASAIRGASWLAQHFAHPERIQPATPEQWIARYDLLEEFLCAAVKYSMVYRAMVQAKDLEALERVLGEILPESSWQQYQQDIRHLRKRGLPLHLPASAAMPAQPSGGKPESEQTQRMRAALAYVSTVSSKPYVDLADFWNECQEGIQYHPDEIRNRLRKGRPLSRTQGTACRLIRFWRDIYNGNLTTVFPGPFPPSRELSALWPQGGNRPTNAAHRTSPKPS